MTGAYADELSAGGEGVDLVERARLTRDYYLRGRWGLDAEALARALEDDPAVTLLAVALDVPRRVGRHLRKPPSLGLLLLVLAVRRARA